MSAHWADLFFAGVFTSYIVACVYYLVRKVEEKE